HFVEELQVFYHDLSNEPQLKCGVGDNIYFDLKFSKFDRLGAVLMDCAIRARSVHNNLNCTQIYRKIQLTRIDELRSFCQIILTHDEPLEITGL
ncbi:MAG: hypothetical protein ABIY70_22900, partial [Capsulimonas sp.]|uniref:hypothetical protein n=1 Tax=Capsulimonas sp. TaxID=2494211 RepID=UPI0032667E20